MIKSLAFSLLLIGSLGHGMKLKKDYDPLSDEYIEYLQSTTSWTAGRNFPRDASMKLIEKQLGTRMDGMKNKKVLEPAIEDTVEVQDPLPQSFDARTVWPECPSIGKVVDQGNCGSDWALAVSQVMTDITCISKKGKDTFTYSAQDILSCCLSCGDGCMGGHPDLAWHYWIGTGVVTGGYYNSNEGCIPYEVPSCKDKLGDPLPECNPLYITPACESKCKTDYAKTYLEDRNLGQTMSYMADDQRAMNDLMTNGPIQTSFEVFDDFIHYKSGVYAPSPNAKSIGALSVKIVGWGTDVATRRPYWLAANSWGENWGDKGFFKILRGQNTCGFENNFYSGKVLTDQ